MATSIYTGKEVAEDDPFYEQATGLTSRSNPFYREAAETAQLQMDDTEAEIDRTEASIDNGEWSYQDYATLARAFVDGQTSNLASELGAPVAAAYVKIFSPEVAADKTLSQIRDEIQLSMATRDAQFMEENTGAAIAANIAGSFFNPMLIKGGQILNQMNTVNKAEKARKAATVARGGPTPAGPATLEAGAAFGVKTAEDAATKTAQMYSGMNPTVFGIASKVNPWAGAAGFGAVTGASYGLGTDGTMDERVSAAGTGAVIGAAIPLALETTGAAFMAATRNKMSQQLGEGSDFVSLMFAGGSVGDFYRTLVGKAYGGRTLMEQQAKNVATKVAAPAEAKKAQLKASYHSDQLRQQITDSLKNNVDDATTVYNTQRSALVDELNTATQNKRLDLKEDLTNRIVELDDIATQGKDAILAAATREVDAVANAGQAVFRGQVYTQATPAAMDDVARAGFLELNPQQRVQYLTKQWTDKGFAAVKEEAFDVQPNVIETELKFVLGKEAGSSLRLLDSGNKVPQVISYIKDEISRMMPAPTITVNKTTGEISSKSSGVVTGKDLMNLRSNIGTYIQNISNNNPQVRESTRALQTYVDDFMMEQLKKKGKQKVVDAFQADRTSWGYFKDLEDAVLRATGKGRTGEFTADEWIETIKANGSYFAARGEGRLQQEAQAAAAASKASETQIKELANAQASKVVQSFKADRASMIKDVARQRLRLSQEATKERAAIDAKFASSIKSKTDKLRSEAAKAQLQERITQQLKGLTDKEERARVELKWFAENIPRDNATTFETLYATGMIGTAVDVITPASSVAINDGFVKKLLLGILGSAGAAREGFQRFLVGQTGWQQGAQRAAESAGQAIQPIANKLGANVGTVGAVTAAGQSNDGTLFSKEQASAIASSSPRSKRTTWEALQKNGKLEQLERENLPLYKVLKAAVDRNKAG